MSTRSRPRPIRTLRAAAAFGFLLSTAVTGCGAPGDEVADMRVNEGSAMDTTPAGTPAPPTPSSIASDTERQTAVILSEWEVATRDDALPAGEITFQVTNSGTEPHALAVDGYGVAERSEPIPPGGASTLTVQLAPGTYRLYCPDGGGDTAHAQRGMSAPFVVR